MTDLGFSSSHFFAASVRTGLKNGKMRFLKLPFAAQMTASKQALEGGKINFLKLEGMYTNSKDRKKQQSY